MRKMLSLTALIGGLVAASTAQADITIGFVTSLSGPGASIGIPYGRGIQAAMEYKNEVNGEKIKLIQLDDGSDPSAATRNARKLIEEEKVDLLIGTATAPSTIAMMAVANELKVPMIAVSPVTGLPNPADQWGICVPQPASLLVKVVADRMKRDAMKNIGYIGFSDAWGDLVYNVRALGEEAGRLDHDVDAEVAPRQRRRVALAEDLDLVAVDDERVAEHRYLARERAEDGVVLEQVAQRGGAREVVDGDDLDVRARLVRRAEDVAADAAEAVDADAYSHGPRSLSQ